MNSIAPPRCLRLALAIAAAGALSTSALKADVLELVNGDHYQGKVISVNENEVQFRSDIQGLVKLPREKVATITMNAPSPTKTAAKSVVRTNAPLVLSGAAVPRTTAGQSDAVVQQMQTEGMDPALINQVQEQIFGKSSPEAAQKYNQLMGGLLSGSISVQDIRVEAQNSINQIREAKRELGGDAGDMLDGYLAILEKFVQESSPSDTVPAPAPVIRSAPTTPVSAQPSAAAIPAPAAAPPASK